MKRKPPIVKISQNIIFTQKLFSFVFVFSCQYLHKKFYFIFLLFNSFIYKFNFLVMKMRSLLSDFYVYFSKSLLSLDSLHIQLIIFLVCFSLFLFEKFQIFFFVLFFSCKKGSGLMEILRWNF